MTNVAVSKDKISIWKEIRCNFHVRSSLMLCRGYLVALGSADIHDSQPERAVYVYKPSRPWLKVASLHLSKCDTTTRIVCVLNDHFVLLGDHRSGAGPMSNNILHLFTFQGKMTSSKIN